MSWKSRQYVTEMGREAAESRVVEDLHRRSSGEGEDVQRVQVHVANVEHSSFDKANWKDAWRRYSRMPWPSRCQILGCGQDASLVAHIYVRGRPKGINWIVPTCDPHNHQRDLECGDNYCPTWVKTKPSVVAIAFWEQTSIERRTHRTFTSVPLPSKLTPPLKSSRRTKTTEF